MTPSTGAKRVFLVGQYGVADTRAILAERAGFRRVEMRRQRTVARWDEAQQRFVPVDGEWSPWEPA